MRIKSYFAPSIQEAMEKARIELGPEAMLISSKKTGAEQGRLGAYEVVFGISGEGATPAPCAKFTAGSPAPEASEGLVRELADLRKQIENVRRSVSRQGYARKSGTYGSPEIEELYEWLTAADFSDEIAHELVESISTRMPASPEELSRASLAPRRSSSHELLCGALREELGQRFRVVPELGLPGTEQRTVAFVGPSGAGKTTSLVKLAFQHGVAQRVPLQILTIDTLRIGGAEQLGAYARILGVGFQPVATNAALEQALEECRSKKLVLIDTPGYGAGEQEEAAELRGFFARNPHVEVQLVLPATLRPAAVSAALARFEMFHPAKLLLTHLDDVETPGAVVDTALRSGLPLSFLSKGQQVPDDLSAACVQQLTDKLFERVRAAGFAAA